MRLEQLERLKALLSEALMIADKMEGQEFLAISIAQALDRLTPDE